MEKLLAVENLSKNYGKRKPVLKAVDLSIQAGEIAGLVGESGSGKSTLAKIIMQLETADAGEVLLNGKSAVKIPAREFYRECQLIFQNAAASFNPSWTVREILQEALANRKKDENSDEYLLEMLGKVKLAESHLQQRPSELSGGEKQRVNLLRAILTEPKLLVCDEIVSSLDRLIQREIVDLLLSLNRELNMAILFISHDLRVVEYMCERIYVMKSGEIVDESRKTEGQFVFSHSYSKKLFNGVMGRGNADIEN